MENIFPFSTQVLLTQLRISSNLFKISSFVLFSLENFELKTFSFKLTRFCLFWENHDLSHNNLCSAERQKLKICSFQTGFVKKIHSIMLSLQCCLLPVVSFFETFIEFKKETFAQCDVIGTMALK